jgi:hypothetical protein
MDGLSPTEKRVLGRRPNLVVQFKPVILQPGDQVRIHNPRTLELSEKVYTIVAIDDKDVLYGTLHYAKLTHPDMQPGEFGQAPLEQLVPAN